MINRLYEIILFIAMFQYLLFTFFLLTHKKGNLLSNRIFVGFLISKSFVIISFLCYFFRHFVYNLFPPINLIVLSFFFLIGPLLYLYTKSITYRDFAFKKTHILHLIPFGLDLIFRSYKFLINPNVKNDLISVGSYLNRSESYLRSILIDIHVFCYIIVALIVLYIYQSEIKKIFSSIERVNLSWLKLILFGFLIIVAFSLTKHSSLLISGAYLDILGIGGHLGSLVFVTIIVYKCLKQPEIFSGIQHKPKYEKSPLTKSDKEKYLKKLISYMEVEKPYLTPTLTLYDLAGKVSIPPHHISQILNTGLNQNFFDFINSYRIDESKRLLSAKASVKKTILEILYETGFNSKSVFNTAFKKQTGMTPTQFRNSQNS